MFEEGRATIRPLIGSLVLQAIDKWAAETRRLAQLPFALEAKARACYTNI